MGLGETLIIIIGNRTIKPECRTFLLENLGEALGPNK